MTTEDLNKDSRVMKSLATIAKLLASIIIGIWLGSFIPATITGESLSLVRSQQKLVFVVILTVNIILLTFSFMKRKQYFVITLLISLLLIFFFFSLSANLN